MFLFQIGLHTTWICANKQLSTLIQIYIIIVLATGKHFFFIIIEFCIY